MSTFITGNAPIGYGQTISGGAPNGSNAFSDADAINNLLNYSGARASATFTNMQLGSNANNMVLSQGANKSLLVAYNTPSNVIPANVTNNNITQTNAVVLDTFGFNKTASTILTNELFEMKSVSPNNGNVYTTDTVTYPVQLSENPLGQFDQNALNYMRILNNYLQNPTVQNMHANGPHNIQYNVSTISNALGKEGVAYYYFGQVNTAPYYLNVSAYETLASNNITLNVSALNTLNATYTYELMKVSYSNPTFVINSTGAGAAHIVDAFGTGNVTPVNAFPTYTYTGFLQSYNYTGLMGATYSSVYSSQLDILLSNPVNVTQAFTYLSGNTGLNVSNGWVSLNNLNSLALVQNTTFANQMNVTIVPSQTTPQTNSSYNNTSYIQIVQQSELLPAGHTLEQMVLNFNSQNSRNTYSNNGAYNTFNTSVIYQVDNLTGMSYLTPAAMSAIGSAAVINTTMAAPSTITTAPQLNITAGFGNATATLNGLYSIYATAPAQNYSGFSVTALQVNSTNVNVIGMLSSSVNMNFTNYVNVTSGYSTSKMPIVVPDNGNYNSSNSSWSWTGASNTYLQLENSFPSNNILGFGVLGGFVNSDLEGYMASLNQFRLLLEPTNPLGTASVNQTGSNVTISAASLNYGGGGVNPTFGSVLEYKVAYNGNGPVSYADFPANTYTQSYSLVFPTVGELAGGILRPQQVLINGYNASGAQLNNQAMVMSLCSSNFSGLSLQTIGQQTTISYNLVIDVALSGLKPFDCRNVAGSQNSGSMYVNIPVSYTVTNNGGGYVYTNGIPSASVNVTFLTQQLYTHKVHMQGLTAIAPGGLNMTASWVDTFNYVNPTTYNVNQYWYVDLRESYDILTFSAVNGNDVPYTFSFALYPQVSLSAPSFTNTYYVEQFASKPSGWSAQIYDLNNQANLQASGFNGLSYDNIVSVVNNPFSVYTTPTVVVTDVGGQSSSINVNTAPGVNVTFYLVNSASGNSPIYFVYTANALVQSVAGWNGTINALVPNGTTTAIAPGVYINSANISNGGHAVGDWISTITLTKDQYYGSAYIGQTGMPYNGWQPIPDPVAGVSVLIPASLNPTYPTGVTTQLQTPYVRGFGYQNGGEQLLFIRSGISANAVFGPFVDNSNVGIAQAAINTPSVLTFNFGQNFGINLALSANPIVNSLTTFNANKTSVTAVYQGVTYSSVDSPSLQILNLVQPVGTSVPWIENLYLNSFFVAGASNTLRIDYQQAPVSFSSANYFTNNAGLNGRQAVEGASYTLRAAFTDNQIVNAPSNVVGVDQVFTDFDLAYMLRKQAKAFYITVAPIDVRLGLLTAPNFFNNPTMSYWYVSLNSNSVPVTGVSVDGLTAPYNFLVQYDQQLAKATPPSTSDFMFFNDIYSLRGSQDSGVNWVNYFTNADLFNGSNIPSSITVAPLPNNSYSITFQQTGYAPSSGDVVVLTFSGLYMQPLFGGAWSAPISVTPATLSYLAQYELNFSVNNTSKLIQPIVTKYTSQVYNSNYLTNLTSTNGYYTQLTCAAAQQLNNPVSVAGLPYQYLNATQYPLVSSNPLIVNPTFSAIPLPANMDLAYQVKNGATGSAYYFQWMAVQAGNFVDAKVVSLFAKDQMVVTDYAGNLSMRVGPDGHFYAGDISTYSIAMNDNQSANPPAINGLLAPILNSDVNLNNPF